MNKVQTITAGAKNHVCDNLSFWGVISIALFGLITATGKEDKDSISDNEIKM